MLKQLLPERLREIPELAAVLDAWEPAVQDAQDAVWDWLAQLTVDTATWGLALWERDYGLTPDPRQTIEERRGAVKVKMRGMAVTTAQEITRLVDTMIDGRSECIEHPAEYMVEVLMTLSPDAQYNLARIQQAVREVLPAHLGLQLRQRMPVESGQRVACAVHVAQKIRID